MISKETLRQVVTQQKSMQMKETVRRAILDEVLNSFDDNRVIILTGIRRCGKSTLLQQIMHNKKGYCYVNFEDERFLDLKAQDFELLNEVLIEVYNNPSIYFFDEVQNIERFETFVRRLQDQDKKVVITGSNATLLSKELGTKLTGRYKQFEVYPFSFTEYLHFNKIIADREWLYDVEKKIRLVSRFSEYRTNGGFPEYIRNKDDDYIRTIFENILYRDIIARYSIKRQKVLKEIVQILLTNITIPFTYNAIKKNVGLKNAITVKEYISYLHNSYLFFELQKFDFSIKMQLNAPKKIYVIDSSLCKVTGLNFSPNKWRMLENVVFIELKRRKKEVYYYSDKKECDFLTREGSKITQAIQVCYILNESNKDREIRGILEASSKLKIDDLLILTNEQEDEIKIEGKTIKVIPVWKWLIAKE